MEAWTPKGGYCGLIIPRLFFLQTRFGGIVHEAGGWTFTSSMAWRFPFSGRGRCRRRGYSSRRNGVSWVRKIQAGVRNCISIGNHCILKHRFDKMISVSIKPFFLVKRRFLPLRQYPIDQNTQKQLLFSDIFCF